MKPIRKHLTYANVLTTIGVFVLLAGGTAIAAKSLGKKTVGPKQLKTNAVTTPKIKKGAVTKAKIADGAIDTSKIADASVTGVEIADGAVSGAKLATAGTVFSQRVARLAPNATVPFAAATVYPVGSYTQNAGEDNLFLGGLDVRFGAGCTPPRSVVAVLAVDAANPAVPTPAEYVGLLIGEDKSAGELTRRFDFGPLPGLIPPPSRTAPGSATPHNFSIYLSGASCSAGSGVDVVGALVDVIGTK